MLHRLWWRCSGFWHSNIHSEVYESQANLLRCVLVLWRCELQTIPEYTHTHTHRHLLSLVAIRQKLRALYLKSNVPSRLHLGFHWRDFHENSRLALHAKSLQGKRVGCDQWIIKGTLLEEQCTFSAESRLPREGFSWKFIPVTPSSFATDRIRLVAIDQ